MDGVKNRHPLLAPSLDDVPTRIARMEDVHKPRHIAIIMDGNGRWASARGLPRIFGHRAGADSVRRIVEAACELGVKALTLYAFSWENWDRPGEEIQELMGLLDDQRSAAARGRWPNGRFHP